MPRDSGISRETAGYFEGLREIAGCSWIFRETLEWAGDDLELEDAVRVAEAKEKLKSLASKGSAASRGDGSVDDENPPRGKNTKRDWWAKKAERDAKKDEPKP